MKFNIEGRIRNLRLPDGRTALINSIFEAVTNGVHAIEERFGGDKVSSQGEIRVVVDESGEKAINSVQVIDNGIGLNVRHLEAFQTCDTLDKAATGGRGVGRLIWFKAFKSIEVRSAYLDPANKLKQAAFRFDPFKDDSLQGLMVTDATGSPGTTVTLHEPTVGLKSRLTPTLLVRLLCHHFFPYFIGGGMPKLLVSLGRFEIDVGHYLSKRMKVGTIETLDLSGDGRMLGSYEISHVYVDPKIARQLSNSILFTAHRRVVLSDEIERKFALKQLEGPHAAYSCVVKGEYLDDNVDQERVGFKIPTIDFEELKEKVLERAELFLGRHIEKIRNGQKQHVVALLEEHPQLAVSVSDVSGYVKSLSPGMNEEDIGKTLFTLLYRTERKMKADIRQIEAGAPGELVDKDKLDSLVKRVNDAALRRLAEYTIKRHQIIQIARSMLRYSPDAEGKYELEKSIHELICPMGRDLHP